MLETQVIPPMFTMKNGAERFLSLCARSNTALTYDDVLLVPQFSDIATRSDVNTSTSLVHRKLKVPLIAANMDTICDSKMAIAMARLGGCGVIHRYMSNEDQIAHADITYTSLHKLGLLDDNPIIAAAIGVNATESKSWSHVVNLIENGVNTIVIDIAHGHHIKVAEIITWIKQEELVGLDDLPVEIIAGNVATSEGVKFLYECGADTIKIGVGPGAVCTTRSVTGHGVPQLYALAIAKEFSFLTTGGRSFKIIADGGIQNSGDIVKALACGVDAVMLGSLFAGTKETPGKSFQVPTTHGLGRLSKVYRGMASKDAQAEFYGLSRNAPEGINKIVPYKGEVKQIVEALQEGIMSGLSYSGALTSSELYEKADWVAISTSGLKESLTA